MMSIQFSGQINYDESVFILKSIENLANYYFF